MRLLAIDPGTTESAYVVIDVSDRRPLRFGKVPNDELLPWMRAGRTLSQPTLREVEHIAIEMVASYGMAVGREVFETCVWIGKFAEALHWVKNLDLVYRRDIKSHHCHSTKANDSNVKQALVDRFASGVSNHGKGSKADPGWFYGFAKDIWQAYALAVYAADQLLLSREQPTQHTVSVSGDEAVEAGTVHSAQGALL
jgi:hypothetical protein